MKHIAVYSITRYGRCGWVASGGDPRLQFALDAIDRTHKTRDGIGLYGYEGFKTFAEAVDAAAKWEAEERIMDRPPAKAFQ